jgi:predicted O-methyltransferase YrrM
MNFKKIPLRYRDIIEETGEIGLPADADLWERTRDFIEKNNLKSTFINILTCHHDEEGYELHNNKSVQPTIDSINKINHIILNMEGRTFHNHYHILYDLCSSFSKDNINYLEIGTYCGASASLMASHEKVRNVFSIDIGNPINKEIPISNVKKFKNENCNYLYIEGDSREKSIVTYVKNNLPKIDILFIDGDHSYNAVIEDFNNYKDVVSKNGFIVFDDYMDFIHSPHVNSAVNDIVKTLNPKKFEIIGSVKYNLLKETNEPNLESSNEFIIRKK